MSLSWCWLWCPDKTPGKLETLQDKVHLMQLRQGPSLLSSRLRIDASPLPSGYLAWLTGSCGLLLLPSIEIEYWIRKRSKFKTRSMVYNECLLLSQFIYLKNCKSNHWKSETGEFSTYCKNSVRLLFNLQAQEREEKNSKLHLHKVLICFLHYSEMSEIG